MQIDLNELLKEIIRKNQEKVSDILSNKIANILKEEYEYKITEALENIIDNKISGLTDYFIQTIHKITTEKLTDITEAKVTEYIKKNKKINEKIKEFLDLQLENINIENLVQKFFEAKKDELSNLFFDRMLNSMKEKK